MAIAALVAGGCQITLADETAKYDGGSCTVCGSDQCVDVSSDPDHCGACDLACAAGEACSTGTCGAADDAGVGARDAANDAGAGARDAGGCVCDGGTCVALASCLDVLECGLSRGDGLYTVEVGGSVLDVWCDMTVRGGGWTLLTNHQASAGFFGNDAGGLETSVADPTAGLYSILGRVESFRRDGAFELLYWNRQHDEQLVSRQTSSPLDASRAGGCADGWTIVEASYTSDRFCGYTPGPPGESTINGYGANWNHAVGQHRIYSDWPLVCTYPTGYQCNHVQLYVR